MEDQPPSQPMRPRDPPRSSPPPPPASSSSPPPGWHFDGAGQRWWDGASWGPTAPSSTRSNDDRTLSILAHGGVLFGGFILPLVLYLISEDRDRPETRWHAREALNFQITFVVVYVAGFLGFFATLALSGVFAAQGPDDPLTPGVGVGVGISFFGFFGLFAVMFVANFAFSIIGALRANEGVRWKYPVRYPFIKADRRGA